MAKNKKVWTPTGYQEGPFNSMVSKGESIIDYTNGAGTLVTKGQYGKDTEKSSVKDGDQNVIAGNDLDILTGKTFAEQLAPHTALIEKINKGDKQRQSDGHMSSLSKITQQVSDREKQKYMTSFMKPITDRQQAQHELERTVEGGGRIAHYDVGKTMFNLIPTIAGLGNSWAQYRHWKKEPLQYHDTYAANPYENMALNGLAALRFSPYPSIQASGEAERRAAYANENAGLSSGQRYLGRLGLGIGAMRNAANVYANAEQQNNALKTQYYNTALNAGIHDAQRRQNAAQYGWSDYVAAHGRKTKGIETAMANAQNILNSFVKNWNTDKINRDTIDLYRQKVNIDEQRLNAYLNELHGKAGLFPDLEPYNYAQDAWYAPYYKWSPADNKYISKRIQK